MSVCVVKSQLMRLLVGSSTNRILMNVISFCLSFFTFLMLSRLGAVTKHRQPFSSSALMSMCINAAIDNVGKIIVRILPSVGTSTVQDLSLSFAPIVSDS